MNENNLKPCPFCGGEASLYMDNHKKYFAGCENCNFYYGIEIEHDQELYEGWRAIYDTREEAIAAWNRRTCSCKKQEG